MNKLGINNKKTIQIFLLVLIVVSFMNLNSCQSLRKKQDKTDYSKIYLFQNNKETELKKNDEIIIERKPFSIRFYLQKYEPFNSKFYAAEIAAFLDQKYMNQLKNGLNTENSVFASGNGLASEKDGYKELIFNNNGFHYLYYINENDKRINLIEKGKKYQKFEFPVQKFIMNNHIYSLKELPVNKFYLVVFIDRNLNKTIDKGELYKLSIIIKD